MSTFDEVIAAVRANIAALDEAPEQIESTKAKAEQAQQQAAMLGSERLAHGAQGLKSSCEQAQRQIAAAKEKLQELIARTNQLKAYEPGGGGARSSTPHGTVATQHSDDTPLPEPDGQKLVEDSQEGSQQGRYQQMMGFLTRQGDGVGDSVIKPAAEHVYTAKAISSADLQPPDPSSLVASTQARTEPEAAPQPVLNPKEGSIFVGAVAVSIVAVKGTEKAGKAVNRLWNTWKGRGR